MYKDFHCHHLVIKFLTFAYNNKSIYLSNKAREMRVPINYRGSGKPARGVGGQDEQVVGDSARQLRVWHRGEETCC